jgi:RHS repeat-associated protein
VYGYYRYGFNGQEKSDEIAGAGNSYTAEYWQYDARLGRRWNLDPVPTTSLSGYNVLEGNPIRFTDPLGNTWFDKAKAKLWSLTHGGGGRVQKSSDGKNWIAYGAQPDGGGISIRRFKDHHIKLKFEFKGEVSLGLQGSVDINLKKIPLVNKLPIVKNVGAKLDLNFISVNLFEGSTNKTYDLTSGDMSQTTSSYHTAGDFSAVGDLWRHGFGIELAYGKDSVQKPNIIGYKLLYSYRTNNGYNGLITKDGSESVEHKGYWGQRSIPFFGDGPGYKNGGLFPNTPWQVNPRVKTTFEMSTKGVSMQTNLNFNYLLKVDGTIKLGIEYE